MLLNDDVGGGLAIYRTKKTKNPYRKIIVHTRSGTYKPKKIYLDSKRYEKYGHLYDFGADDLIPSKRQTRREPFTKGQLDYQKYFGELRHLKVNPKVFGPEYVDAQLINKAKDKIKNFGITHGVPLNIEPIKRNKSIIHGTSINIEPIKRNKSTIHGTSISIEPEHIDAQVIHKKIPFKLKKKEKVEIEQRISPYFESLENHDKRIDEEEAKAEKARIRSILLTKKK